jgi:hypothetical protein
MPPATPVVLSDAFALCLVIVGIFFSIILPIAVRTIKKLGGGLELNDAPKPTWPQRLKTSVILYLGKGYTAAGYVLAAFVIACAIVYFLDMHFYKPRDALMAGFAWESFLNKLFQSNQAPKANG